MHVEYLLALGKVGQVNANLAVETSCSQQGFIEHVYTVGSSKYYYTAIGAESVHFGKQGVERILALVIASHCRILATCTTYGINLVDEDDTWSLLLGLTEQVANTTCTYTYKHFDKVRTAH